MKVSMSVSVDEVAHRADVYGAHYDTLDLLKDVSRQGVAEAARRPGNQPGILRHPRFPLTCEMFWIFGFFADAHGLVVLRSRGVELHRRALPVTAKSPDAGRHRRPASLPAATPPARRLSLSSSATGDVSTLAASFSPSEQHTQNHALLSLHLAPPVWHPTYHYSDAICDTVP